MTVIIADVGDIRITKRMAYFDVAFQITHPERKLMRRLTGEIRDGQPHWAIWRPDWCARLKGMDVSGLVHIEEFKPLDLLFVRFPGESYNSALGMATDLALQV